MAEKDITEKLLEDYNDVFADIVNGLLFNGKPVIEEYSLVVGNIVESIFFPVSGPYPRFVLWKRAMEKPQAIGYN